jgi:hypothetical protein
MATPVKKKIKVLDATYMEDKKGVFLSCECDEGDFYHMLDRDALGTFGTRSEDEITEEMCKTAELMVNKTMWLVFDPEAEDKIQNGEVLSYKNLPESKKEETDKNEKNEEKSNETAGTTERTAE